MFNNASGVVSSIVSIKLIDAPPMLLRPDAPLRFVIGGVMRALLIGAILRAEEDPSLICERAVLGLLRILLLAGDSISTSSSSRLPLPRKGIMRLATLGADLLLRALPNGVWLPSSP